MNAENFSHYIEDASLLYQMNYEELKQLLLQYPFNANLRYLLLQKSEQENHPDFERNLRSTAISSPDRAHLFQYINGTMQPAELEERLELKSLQELDLDTNALVFEQVETETEAVVFSTPQPLRFDLDSTFEEEDQPLPKDQPVKQEQGILPENEDAIRTPLDKSDLGFVVEEEVQTPSPTIEEKESLEDDVPVIEPIVEAEEPIVEEREMENDNKEIRTPLDKSDLGFSASEPIKATAEVGNTEKLMPTPRHALAGWGNRYQVPKICDKDRYDPRALRIVRQSVEDSEEIATETLANLLVRQGRFQRAIEVYERLSLLFPEKSHFFAVRIEEIHAQKNVQ